MRQFWFACWAIFWVKTALANSYVEMITTPPPEAELSQPVSFEAPVRPFVWYDSRIKTSSPVVTSSYPKYAAWVRSMENENFIDNTRDELQHLVYMVEGGLLGLGLYEVYFRR